jgi:carboxymethylenebutenolidase
MRQRLGVCAVTGAVIAACHSGGGAPASEAGAASGAEGPPTSPSAGATPPPASSYPAATQPVAEGTLIVTDSHGLVAGMIEIPTIDRPVPAYRAAPADRAKPPVVLVVQEIFGVHEHIKDVCRRLAKLGYMAIAPELFVRQGDVSQLKSIDEVRAVVAKVPDHQVLSDLDAAIVWAKDSGGDVKRLAITGFCWGGRITWLYAAQQPQVKAAVAWYGRLVGSTTPLTPQNPMDVVDLLKAPVLGLYGGKDEGIPSDTVASFREALKKAGKPSEIEVYPDAGHAFFADYRPSYREGPAEDGWRRLQAWLKEHGV